MNALISGQAGIALMIEGVAVSAINIDTPDEPISYPQTAIPYLLAGATDVVELKSVSREIVFERLTKSWEKDRCLQLMLLLLSRLEDIEDRKFAASCLKALIKSRDTYDHICNILYSAPLPESADLIGSALLVQGIHGLESLIDELNRDQEIIFRYYQDLVDLPVELFGDIDDKIKFQEEITNLGVIRGLVKAGYDPASFGLARVQYQQELQYLRNSRQIFGQWLKGLAPKSRSGDIKGLEEEEIYENGKQTAKHIRYKQRSSLEAYENVKKQKMAIVRLLKSGKLIRMRKYVDQLVEYQLKSGDPKYAAMSLCDLSQRAKDVSNHSLQLELAQLAVDVAPDDSRSHGHVADAYFCLSQYDDALRWFKSAESLGGDIYARTGYARVLRAKGKLDEALAICQQAIIDFPSETIFWSIRAEVLRDMWCLDDALKAYDDAIREFPDEIIPRNGRASVLKDLGMLEESLSSYEALEVMFGDNGFSRNGRASVLKEMGRYNEALEIYVDTMRMFPDDSVAYCGHAEVLKEMCRLDEAILQYEKIIEAFPYNVIPYCGKAGVLRDSGKYDEAILAYDNIIKRFPYENRAYNGKAWILKKLGKYGDSLRLYDDAISNFPYNIISMKGRAEVLKELGRLQDALEAYDTVIRRDPRNKGVLYSKAAILAANEEFEEALAILPDTQPRTREEWVAFHIRGMIYLRSNKIDSAIELFQYALSNISFIKERKYFENAFVVAKLRLGRHSETTEFLSEDKEPVRDILRIHVYGLMSQLEEAEKSFRRVEASCPQSITQLKDELAYRFQIKIGVPERTWDWVFDQECRMLLLEAA